MNTKLETDALDDVQLVERCRRGDRDAFGRIVERYQALICALAYGTAGDLQASEDLAQVTFITAWREMPKLHEPAKLKAWLCGIARNVINSSVRQRRRAPTANAEILDDASAFADTPSPHDHAVSKEEQAILWRTLHELPPAYREPLVLFYRQNQSAAEVAEALGLTEETVHQRLSRGRAMLTERVAQFVETTLRHTGPTRAFSGHVLAALPAVAGAAAAGTTGAAHGAISAKTGSLGLWLVPFVGVIAGMTAHWLIIRTVATQRERRVLTRSVIGCWAFALAWPWLGQPLLRALGRHESWSDRTLYTVMAGFWWVFAIVIATLIMVMFRRLLALRPPADSAPDANEGAIKPGLAGRIVITAGMYLAYFWGLIFIAWEAHDRAGAIIVAVVAAILGAGYFFHLRGKKGPDGLRFAIRHVVLACAAMLAIINLRLDVWLASFRGASLAEIHELLPMAYVYGLTLAFCLWIVIGWAMSRPSESCSEP